MAITGRSAAAADLRAVAEQADGCQRCDLYQRATQTVFGEGPVPARAMLVGEQPGDREDLDGHPFVGPAGRVLGSGFRVTQERGRPLDSDLVEHVVATVHPSSILRGPEEERSDAYAAFVRDLEAAFALLP